MRAIQHDAIRNFPDLGLVLMPGVATLVTPEQAAALQTHGITLLPETEPVPPSLPPPIPAPIEEYDR